MKLRPLFFVLMIVLPNCTTSTTPSADTVPRLTPTATTLPATSTTALATATIPLSTVTSTLSPPTATTVVALPSLTPTAASPTVAPSTIALNVEVGWQLGSPMPSPARSELPAVTLDGLIYVPGGFGDERRLDAYDPLDDAWQTLAPMPDGRHHLMATAFNDSLYIIGGAIAGSWNPGDTVWRYDPPANTWTELPPMPESRLAGAAVTLDDKIYVVGGAGGSEALLEWMPDSGGWRSLSGPGQPREHVNAVAFQNELWVIGGRWQGTGELATVEIFDPTIETWREGPSMNVARAGFAAAVVRDHLFVAGGEVIINGQETLGLVEVLAPDSDTWQFAPELPVPMHGVGGAAFEGRFVLLGGSIRAGAIENEGQVQIYQP